MSDPLRDDQGYTPSMPGASASITRAVGDSRIMLSTASLPVSLVTLGTDQRESIRLGQALEFAATSKPPKDHETPLLKRERTITRLGTDELKPLDRPIGKIH